MSLATLLRAVALGFGLAAWQVHGHHAPYLTQPTCGGQEKPLFGLDENDAMVCYEHVRVIKVVVGSPAAHHDQCQVCIDRDISGHNDCEACVTVVGPYDETPGIEKPVTKTITPSPGSDGVTTVVIRTPTSASLRPLSTQVSAYTGTSPLTAPVTETRQGNGDEPPIVVIQTPEASPEIAALGTAGYITITTAYTGSLAILEPITTTIPPRGTRRGTVLIQTPTTAGSSLPVESDDPLDESSPVPTPESSTSDVLPDPEPTSTGPPPGPTFSCDEGGFLIQQRTLFRLNLETGENPTISTAVGPGGNINALGYNVLDNFLYGFVSTGSGQQQLIQINAEGGHTLLDLQVDGGLNVGDIDDAGQFWVSERGFRWIQVDLDPDSPSFGEQVDEGTSPGTPVADWAFLENGGPWLYSIRLASTARLVRWSMEDNTWEELFDYGAVVDGNSGFGALYAVGDELWGSDNQSGDIIAFPVLQEGEEARKITDGPSTSSNDGARCFLAPALSPDPAR